MTKAQEIEHMHNLLEEMLANAPKMIVIPYQGGTHGYTRDEGQIIRVAMEAQELIKTYSAQGQGGQSELTPKRRDIAREPGGYKGHLQAQKSEKQRRQAVEDEQRQLTRTSTEAAVRSADAADRSAEAAYKSVKWAKAGVAIAVAALLASIAAIFIK